MHLNVEEMIDGPAQAILSQAVDHLVATTVERLADDHARVGSLSADRILTVCERRGLDAAQMSAVRSELERRGFIAPKLAPAVEGWGGKTDGDAEVLGDFDLLGHYLSEIGRYPLLNAEDERRLGRRVRAAMDLRATIGERDSSRQEKVILADGRRAEEQLYCANLRLVVSIARRHQGQRLEILDLIQHGNIGLATAVKKFDHRMGYKFSTYATWWIRQSIDRGVSNESRVIRLPVHVVERVRRVRGTRLHLTNQAGREPTLIELADQLHMDPGEVQFLLDISEPVSSLDAPVGEGELTRGDLVADPAPGPEDVVLGSSYAADLVEELLEGLDPRSQEILRLRFGLDRDDGTARTLEVVGELFGLTRERIRQVEKKALAKLQAELIHRGAKDIVDLGETNGPRRQRNEDRATESVDVDVHEGAQAPLDMNDLIELVAEWSEDCDVEFGLDYVDAIAHAVDPPTPQTPSRRQLTLDLACAIAQLREENR